MKPPSPIARIARWHLAGAFSLLAGALLLFSQVMRLGQPARLPAPDAVAAGQVQVGAQSAVGFRRHPAVPASHGPRQPPRLG